MSYVAAFVHRHCDFQGIILTDQNILEFRIAAGFIDRAGDSVYDAVGQFTELFHTPAAADSYQIPEPDIRIKYFLDILKIEARIRPQKQQYRLTCGIAAL